MSALALLLLLARGGQETPTADIEVAGLAGPVEVRRDRWGVNHIYAHNEADLFFAQGYCAARDRLFQLEMWRRQATGTLAEILGRRALAHDRGARLHRFRGDLDADLAHYHPRGKAVVEAFVRGINAHVAEMEGRPEALPVEFKWLGIVPGRWTPEVVVSRHQALTSNVRDEVRFLRALKTLSPEALRDLTYLQGGDPGFVPDAAVDPGSFPDEALELYEAFRNPVEFLPEDVSADVRAAAPRPPAPVDAGLALLDVGSNNWVLSGARTVSTHPLLANDPHRRQAAPSLRYWVHLVAPGWNVIGGGEPSLPGVSIGHNEHGAWGLTIFGNDNEDLYVYDVNPENPDEYRYQGRWEPMRVLVEEISVKDGPPVTVRLKYTRHGPVLHEDPARRKAYALRAAWMELGCAPYLASLRMNQARTWEEFRAACAYNRMPSLSMVWGDRSGTIGRQSTGIQPRRRAWSGLLPVPGDGRFEWDGFLPILDLPHEANPARGYVATANNYLFPNDYPFREALHYRWAEPWRGARIAEVIESGRRFGVSDMVQLQNDHLSLPARALVPLLADLAMPNAAVADARDRLLAWDHVLDRDSVPAGIYAMWQRRILERLFEMNVPEAARPILGPGAISLKRAIDWLHAPDGRFGADPTAGRDAFLARCLGEAVAELTARFGADPAAWRWGQDTYHHALLRHPLSAVVNQATRAELDVGPAPRGGDGTTVSATSSGDVEVFGGSFKLIADLEDWDNSVGLNSPGQSGDPDSPFYRNLFEMWSKGRYFPAAYSRKKVESVTHDVTWLRPAR